MVKKRKKKVNPHRIPLAKSEIDENAILEEATKDDLHHAWLLVFNALIEMGEIELGAISDITERVNTYIRNSAHYSEHSTEEEMRRAERLMGLPCPNVNMSVNEIKSAVQLEKFKQRVYRVAIYTALSVLCLGLYSTGKFCENHLHRIFLHADLTLAEIENGTTSFKDLEKAIASYGVMVERENDDLHHAKISESAELSSALNRREVIDS